MPKSRNRKNHKQKVRAWKQKVSSAQNRVRNYFQKELMKEIEIEAEKRKEESPQTDIVEVEETESKEEEV